MFTRPMIQGEIMNVKPLIILFHNFTNRSMQNATLHLGQQMVRQDVESKTSLTFYFYTQEVICHTYLCPPPPSHPPPPPPLRKIKNNQCANQKYVYKVLSVKATYPSKYDIFKSFFFTHTRVRSYEPLH